MTKGKGKPKDGSKEKPVRKTNVPEGHIQMWLTIPEFWKTRLRVAAAKLDLDMAKFARDAVFRMMLDVEAGRVVRPLSEDEFAK